MQNLSPASQYPRLISEISTRLGVPEWDAEQAVMLDVEGTSIGLLYFSQQIPESLHVCASMGPPGTNDSDRDLLHRNALEFAADNGVFGIHPDSGEVVYRFSISLGRSTEGKDLLNYIAQVLSSVRERERERV